MLTRVFISLLVYFFFCCGYLVAGEKQSVTIVYDKGIAPIKFTADGGKPSGFLIDYWQQLAEKADLDLHFVEADSVDESLKMLKNGQADLHAGIFNTDEGSQFLAYSKPLLDIKYYIYSSPNIPPFTSLAETTGYLLGIVQGGYTENHIKQVIPQAHLIIYKDFPSLFKAALAGEIKAFVSPDIPLNYYFSANNLENPFKHHKDPLYAQSYYGATVKANQSLIETIAAKQELLSAQDIQGLKDRWIIKQVDTLSSPHIKALSRKEIAWVKEHPVIRVSNEMDWPPFDFNQDNQPMGFSIDLLNMVAARTGLKLDYKSGHSWNELQEMLRNKELDVLHSLSYSAARAEFMLFTKPFLFNQTIIITGSNNNDIHDINDLAHKTIAVIKGYYQEEVLTRILGDAKFVYVDSPLQALRSVSSGRADATIRFNGVASYLMNRYLLTNLKFVNEFRVEGDNQLELSCGVRNDWPILRNILQKGLDSVSADEMNTLRRKWTAFGTAPPTERITLTDAEQEWLRNHPEITLGSDFKWPPFDFAGQNGQHTGLSADYINLIKQRTGLKINIRTGVWEDILKQMQNGKLDGLACAVKTKERTAYLDFTKPYLKVPTVIIVRDDNQSISDLSDLNGKTVSINKSSYLHDWMVARYPQIKLNLSTSNEASIEAVSYGEADAYIGNLAVANYLIRKRLLTNLTVVKRLDDMMTETAVAIDKRQPLLLSIIQKALNSITELERQEILDKWYAASTEEKVILTKKEQLWLDRHPHILVSGAPDCAPLSYLDKSGRYVGIVAEYLKIISEKSDLKFETIPSENWSNALQMIQQGRVDIINAITRVSGQANNLNVTDGYIQTEAVLVTRNDIQFLKRLEDIDDERLGTIQNFVTAEYLQRDYPSLPLQLYDNAAVGLQALSHGDIDIFIIDIPTFEYYCQKLSLANLKISGVTPYVFQIAFGVTKENPELLSILNKTLGLISQKEKNHIYNSWITQQKPLIDYSLVWKIALGAGVFLILLFSWNRRLTHEVTLRKQAEDAALQASRAKSDFLANMSHEIRTPMNSVLGFAELLDNMINDPEQKSYLKSIRTSGRALMEIINDILDLSKIEARKMAIKPEPLSIKGLFVEMDNLFKARIAQKNLQFSFQLAEDFPPYVNMDPVRLRQVLINLIGNALKFTEKGSIRLLCHDVQIDEETNSIDFTLTVADTGMGVPLDQQQGIFNKFEQQEGLDNARYGGTGLGLSICRSFTELMGGSISVKSSPGQGSDFSVAFTNIPIAEENIVQEASGSMSVSQFKPANVLIADDVKDNRRLVTGHFKGSSVQFYEAGNGREALELLLQVPMDMVFMDLRMPVLNGYETITAMKQNEASQHIPVVAFTASVMGEDLEKVNQYGFDAYLRKPVSRQELLRVAAQFLPFADSQPEHQETAIEPADFELPQLQDFLTIIETDLLPFWQTVKDKGDFDLISQFALKLHQQAVTYSIVPIVDFTKRLQEYVASYDIIEVDGMMKQFPALVSAMKQQVLNLGEEK